MHRTPTPRQRLVPVVMLCVGVALWAALRPSPPAENLDPPDAFAALTQWQRERAYPNEHLADRTFRRAYEQHERAVLARPAKTTATGWEAAGPMNVPGRMLAIAFNKDNPQTLYAGSASGGLWRTHTAGEGERAWHRVATGHPVLSVAAVALAPDDSSTIVIGTGEVYNVAETGQGGVVRETRGSYGIGILRSTDGGATWSVVLPADAGIEGDDVSGVQMLRFNPQNAQTLWAATTAGLLVSYDQGDTWQRRLDVVMGTDVWIHPTDTLRMVAAMGNLGSPGHGLYRSADGGASWAKITDGLPTAYFGKALLAAYAARPDTLYASIGAGSGSVGGEGTWLARSTDAGATWSVINTTDYAVYQGWFSHVVVPHPTDDDRLLTAGVDIWRSADAGATLGQRSQWMAWSSYPPVGGPYAEGGGTYSHADHHAFALHPDDPSTVYFANDGGISRTTNFGQTFEIVSGGLQTGQFYPGTALSHQTASLFIGGLQDNASVQYEGGPRWRMHIGGDGGFAAIDPQNDSLWYVSAQRLALFITRDRGREWRRIDPPQRDVTSFISPYVLAPSNPLRMYAARDIVYRSTNRGYRWSPTNGNLPLDGNPVQALAVAPNAPDVVYATTAPVVARAGLWRTLDGGTTWTNVTGTLPDRYLTDLAIHPDEEGTVYVTASGTGTPHVFKTTDFGETWTAVGDGLPDLPTSAITFDPMAPEMVYVGNDLGVYLSHDGGASWTPFTEGLPEAVMVVDLNVSRVDRTLFAATHGHGLFTRRLGVVTSTPPPTPAPRAGVLRIDTPSPHPVTGTATIRFELAQTGHVHLSVYDLTGRRVATLASGYRQAGRQVVRWSPEGLAAGSYVLRLDAGSQSTSRPVVVAR